MQLAHTQKSAHEFRLSKSIVSQCGIVPLTIRLRDKVGRGDFLYREHTCYFDFMKLSQNQ